MRVNGKSYSEWIKEEPVYNCRCVLKSMPKNGIEKVIFNKPATIVIWENGEKTVVKCQDGDVYDKEKGLLMCIAKYHFGNGGNYNNIIKKWVR